MSGLRTGSLRGPRSRRATGLLRPHDTRCAAPRTRRTRPVALRLARSGPTSGPPRPPLRPGAPRWPAGGHHPRPRRRWRRGAPARGEPGRRRRQQQRTGRPRKAAARPRQRVGRRRWRRRRRGAGVPNAGNPWDAARPRCSQPCIPGAAVHVTCHPHAPTSLYRAILIMVHFSYRATSSLHNGQRTSLSLAVQSNTDEGRHCQSHTALCHGALLLLGACAVDPGVSGAAAAPELGRGVGRARRQKVPRRMPRHAQH